MSIWTKCHPRNESNYVSSNVTTVSCDTPSKGNRKKTLLILCFRALSVLKTGLETTFCYLK